MHKYTLLMLSHHAYNEANNKYDSNVGVQYVIHKYIACFTLAVFDLEKLQILTVNVHNFKVRIHNNCCLFNELYFFKGQNSTRRLRAIIGDVVI